MLERNVEESFLKTLIENQTPIYIFLKNGIKLTGKIEGVSKNAIFLGGNVKQMVFKRHISTIVDLTVLA